MPSLFFEKNGLFVERLGLEAGSAGWALKLKCLCRSNGSAENGGELSPLAGVIPQLFPSNGKLMVISHCFDEY